MNDKNKSKENEPNTEEKKSAETTSRRDFLLSLGKWSAIIISAIGAANLVEPPPASGWVNGRGGAWVNGRGGGGGWVNRNVGGGSWVNRNVGGGSWVNRNSGWINGGGSWVNGRGGGGSWVNRH